MAEGYQARLPNRVVPQRAPEGPSLGAALASGIGQVAAAGLRLSEQDRQVQRQVEASELRIAQVERQRAQQQQIAGGMAAMADARVTLERELADLRTTKAQPGAAGHEQAAADAIARAQQAVLDRLGDDPEVRDRFAGPLANMRAEAQTGEDSWARVQRVKFGADAADRLGDQMNNALLASPDPATWRRNIESMDDLFAGMALEPDQRSAAQRRFANGQTKALLDGYRLAGQWQAAKALVESGQLDGFLEDTDKKLYLQQFGNDAAIADREAAAAQAEVKTAAKEKIDALQVMIDNGEDVPDAAIRQALAAGKAAGLPDDVLLKAGYLAEHAANRRSFAGMSTPVLEQQVATLRGKQQAGELKPAEARALDDADKALKGRDDGLAAKLGPMLKGGPEGRLAGVGQLAAMPAERARRVAEAAGDPQAAIVAGLPAEARPWAVAGRAKRLASKDAYEPAVPKGQKPQDEIDRQLRSVLGAVAADVGGDFGLVRETALDIMANSTSGWDARQFGRAVQVAAGMTRRGDGSNQGGIGTVRGRQIELPAKWNQAEFDRAYSRFDFAGAVYRDGGVARAEDVRQHFRPKFDHVDEGRTVYQLIGPDGRPLYRKSDKGVQPFYLMLPERP